jgi:hypothetical protein
MDYPVKVFEVTNDAKPGERPRELPGFAVSGESADDARRSVLARLTGERRAVRTLSFTADGGLAAVVLPPAPEPKPAAPSRRRRGGR